MPWGTGSRQTSRGHQPGAVGRVCPLIEPAHTARTSPYTKLIPVDTRMCQLVSTLGNIFKKINSPDPRPETVAEATNCVIMLSRVVAAFCSLGKASVAMCGGAYKAVDTS